MARSTTAPAPPHRLVVVASSAGGLRALIQLLGALPEDFPAATAVVQHLDPRHESMMDEILSRRCPLRVSHAGEGIRLKAGAVFLAPPDRHLLVNEDGTLSLSRSALVHFVRPSADLLFESAAGAYGDRVVAVVLTGTGSDGAMGVQAVHKAGGTVIVQEDPEFTGMPQAARKTGCVDRFLPLTEIAPALVHLVQGGTS